jgi:hypothetical protein
MYDKNLKRWQGWYDNAFVGFECSGLCKLKPFQLVQLLFSYVAVCLRYFITNCSVDLCHVCSASIA